MTEVRSTSSLEPALQTSWLPMLVIAMAQILLSFNVNALRVSIGGIVSSFGASPSVVGTAIVTHLLLIAANYQGRRQAQAIGWLGASEAMGGVLAFLIAGFLGTWIGWRYSFGVLGVLAAGVLLLSKRLSPVEGRRDFAD